MEEVLLLIRRRDEGKEVTPDFAQFMFIFMVETGELFDTFCGFFHSQMVSLDVYIGNTKIMAQYL
jgi:hypothetical protein